ncbi:uncharacterized protein LOC108678949 [Hyalella azteca]|uniref:Uncharacterized protein LOC108678949 n=1 Tax=Hyalella azteca TaxID=294128 RepID=A0A8B7PCI3_HYAAZ|nr:uncharacterized protein LOC108678949 [Hyalella azteca]
MEDLQKFTSAAMDSVPEKESDEPFLLTKLGVLMSTNSEIARALLSGLSAVQVSRLLSTCRLWRSVGLKELQRRKNFHFISLPSDARSCKRGAYFTRLETDLWSWAQQWRSVPGFCLVLHDKQKHHAGDMLSYCKLLPPDCPVVEVLCDGGGIIYTEEVMAHYRTVNQNISFCDSPKCPNLAFSSNTTLLPKMINTDACTINNSQVADSEVGTSHGMKRTLADPDGCASPSIKLRRSARISQSLDKTSAALGGLSEPQSSNSEVNSDLNTSLVQPLQQEQLRAQQEKAGLNCALCRNILRHNVGPSFAHFINDYLSPNAQLTMMCFPNFPGVTFRPLKTTKKQLVSDL